MNLRGKLYALMVHHGYKLTHEGKEYVAHKLDHNQLRDIIDSYINKITSYGQLQKIEDIHMAYKKVDKECQECAQV